MNAKRTFKFFAGSMKSSGPSVVTMALALDAYVEGRPAEEKKDEKK
jgi:hypothetical protein